MALTSQDIENIVVGTVVSKTIDVNFDMSPRDNARWNESEVVEVFGRGVDILGKNFVCFYTKFGEHSRISCSAAEGDGHVRIVQTY